MKMRDYTNIERYLNQLMGDVYEQPEDAGHQRAIEDVCARWLGDLQNLNAILDVGCGQGQAMPVLQMYAERVAGITLGSDADVCKAKSLEVYRKDMSFLPFADNEFDLIFARHSLEHSPMPLLTLMEWHRVSKQWLCLVVPDLVHFGPSGLNHYYVLNPEQWRNLLDRAGWHPIWDAHIPELEYRWLCEKVRR